MASLQMSGLLPNPWRPAKVTTEGLLKDKRPRGRLPEVERFRRDGRLLWVVLSGSGSSPARQVLFGGRPLSAARIARLTHGSGSELFQAVADSGTATLQRQP